MPQAVRQAHAALDILAFQPRACKRREEEPRSHCFVVRMGVPGLGEALKQLAHGPERQRFPWHFGRARVIHALDCVIHRTHPRAKPQVDRGVAGVLRVIENRRDTHFGGAVAHFDAVGTGVASAGGAFGALSVVGMVKCVKGVPRLCRSRSAITLAALIGDPPPSETMVSTPSRPRTS